MGRKAGLKSQNPTVRKVENAEEIFREGDLDLNITEKMAEGQSTGGNFKRGRKKDETKTAETEIDISNGLRADITVKAVPASKRGRKKDIAKTTDMEVDKLDDLEADDVQKAMPASKRRRKEDVPKTTEAEDNKLYDLDVGDAQKAVPASKRGRRKNVAKTSEADDKLDDAERLLPTSKHGRKEDVAQTTEAEDTLNDLDAGNAEKVFAVIVETTEAEIDKLDLEADDVEKAVPSKHGRKTAYKISDVKNLIDATNNTNKASTEPNINGAVLENKLSVADESMESKSLASEKQNAINDLSPSNIVQATKKRGRKKGETKLQPKEKDMKSVSNVQILVEQKEKSSNKTNETLELFNEVSLEKVVGKRSQRKKLIKNDKLEDKKLIKKDKNISMKNEGGNVEKTELNIKDCKIDILTLGRKRKNKITTIATNSENVESEKVKKHKKITEQGSAASEDSSVIKMEVRIVLERQALEKNDLSTDMIHSDKTVFRERGRATKNKKENQDEGKSDDDFQPIKPTKLPKYSDNSKGSSKKEKIPDVTSLDFSCKSQSSSRKEWNFKISSWNINGIRAWLEKNGLSYLHHEKPDVMCFQETKCSDDKLPEEVRKVDGYHCYWLSGDKDGYSGVGLLTKEEPKKVNYGIGIPEHDNEGRVITAEYDQFYLVATYVPNAGRGLVRLDYRMKWDKDFCAYLKKLDEKKPVILCGDLNVAHQEIDLANPKTNRKNAGFTQEEREGFSSLLGEGFIDAFRHLYPDVKDAYTFWTYMKNARAKNVGWRLDYFVISNRLGENLCDSVIRKDVFGSDHCPLTLFLSI